SSPPPVAQPAASPSRARPPLLFRLRGASCISSSRETDDLALGSRSGNTASDRLWACRGTSNVLSGLVGDEFVEIGVGESDARALGAVTDDDVAERAGGDVAVERLDRAAELGRRLGLRAQAIGRLARLARRTALPLGAVGLAVPTQFADVLQVRLDLFHAVMAAPVFPAGIGAEVIGP